MPGTVHGKIVYPVYSEQENDDSFIFMNINNRPVYIT
jgi:hypothetical protein